MCRRTRHRSSHSPIKALCGYQNSISDNTEFLVGHTGHGCQQVVYDLKNQVSIAYVNNGLKTGLYDLCRTYIRLQNAVYDIVESRLNDTKTL
ncbi:unnamed protein product [Cylicostephanus goldi]|uniref:Uncharacterized protein n=1 Tax=Cylicostephanus goldi TaxID=71465 RepID=A0A3P7MH41_CYLGO|nr:unnamed protein product [Cylicostephanus goldi]